MNLNQLRDLVHSTAVEKGWWAGPMPNVGEKLALMHSELSEALEEYRDGHRIHIYFGDDGKPEGLPIELADCIIRILDFCGFYGIDIEAALLTKQTYNADRPYRHGGKLA